MQTEITVNHIIILTVLFWVIILLYSSKTGILQYVYRVHKNVKLLSGNEKIENCAKNLKQSIKVRAVLGEANSHFWTNPLILESLDYFLNQRSALLQIVVGPYLDVENKEFLKRIIIGMDERKVEIYKSKERKNYHIKEFTMKDGIKKIVAEKPHSPLTPDREKILECTNDKDCENRMNLYYFRALENTEPVKKDEIISKFSYIKYDEARKTPREATYEEIETLKRFIYAS